MPNHIPARPNHIPLPRWFIPSTKPLGPTFTLRVYANSVFLPKRKPFSNHHDKRRVWAKRCRSISVIARFGFKPSAAKRLYQGYRVQAYFGIDAKR